MIKNTVFIKPRSNPLAGTFRVPGDKSISHRALILSALAHGTSRIEGLLESRDTLATLEILQALGVNIRGENGNYSVEGVGLEDLKEPEDVLLSHNSGTTARLMLGILAGSPFFSVITGDESLRRRPMGRVVKPLQKMGATILGRKEGERLPLAILGSQLEGAHHSLEVASAQVKSALLLAGLTARGETVVREPRQTRDHTERMLVARGALLEKEGNHMAIKPGKLKPMDVKVPGDFSSAAFLITASLLIPQSHITIKNVGLNPTRTAFLNMIQEMGGEVSVLNKWEKGGEPIGDMEVTYTPALRGIKVDPRDIPLAIDELPLLALLGTQAQGETRVEGAGELRVKESDRIAVTVSQIAAIGGKIQELSHGFVVRGPVKLQGGKTNSHGDHRMAMLFALAGLISEKGVELTGAQAVEISYPRFFEDLQIHACPPL